MLKVIRRAACLTPALYLLVCLIVYIVTGSTRGGDAVIDGFYWVLFEDNDGEWEVAEYNDGSWSRCGSELTFGQVLFGQPGPLQVDPKRLER